MTSQFPGASTARMTELNREESLSFSTIRMSHETFTASRALAATQQQGLSQRHPFRPSETLRPPASVMLSASA
jgi:predicted DsbA family dithiol-disulfide isomerase